MWWPEFPRMARALAVLALAGLTAGCFQPLYGSQSPIGGKSGVTDKFDTIEVAPIDVPNGTRLARLGVNVRNELIYQFTGGGAQAATNYRLVVRLSSTALQVIVDINTARPDIQNHGIKSSQTQGGECRIEPRHVLNVYGRVLHF